MMGSLSLALRPFGTIAIGAVTLRVASVPSKLPSALTLRLAMVGISNLLRLLGGHPRWRRKKGPRAAVTERHARANPARGCRPEARRTRKKATGRGAPGQAPEDCPRPRHPHPAP